MLTQREVNEWRMHPVTEKVFKILEDDTSAFVASVLSGEIIGDTAEATAMNAAKVVGMVQGISRIFDIEGEVDE